MKSAQNQFPVITQAERMVVRTGKLVEEMIAEERESSSAQIRTLLRWYGIDQFKERVILTLLENQKGLFHNLMIHFRMPVKR